ncbi:DHH family phosphoesterase [Clostridium sp. ZBS18]|uniref:DHH family phosphoesterase n=1 Tax=Clostridium sp. ZBS18 TaxID=2949967 RepID=UPI002079D4E1|nr:DHH family phosphoesterase [Clostridium sp. ZBS18]
MRYKARNKGTRISRDGELLNTLLISRGVNNPSKFLNVDESDVIDGMLLKNMDRGLNMLNWHIENNSKIHILLDVDTDGAMSGSEFGYYIKDINKKANITYSMNQGKKHGIITENIPKEIDLLIVPDAGSNDVKECKELSEKHDIDILIVDHHIIERENQYAIVINNQDGAYPNKTLSGSGVVYKFCKEYDKKYGYNYADKYLDLASIGVVGDSMDLRNYETRYLVLKGLNKINNNLIKEILIKNKAIETLEDEASINIKSVEWDIAPCFNATIRSGKAEEREDMIKAITGVLEDREYKPRKSKTNPNPEIETHTIQKTMARVFNNIRSRQNKLVAKRMENLISKIKEENLACNKVIIVDASDIIEETTFTGLVANKLSDYYKRPVLVLKKFNDTIFGGSGRNFNLSPIEDLNALLCETGLFESVSGHPNAFGIKIKEENVQKATNLLNEKLKDVIMEDVYIVDYEIPIGRLKEKDIIQVGKWADIWGGEGLKEPLFAITDINLNIEDIKLLGDKRNFIRIEKTIGDNKIILIKKYTNEEEYNKMIMKNKKGLTKKSNNKVKLDVIGKFIINKWNDNEYGQIEIVDYNVSKANDFRF